MRDDRLGAARSLTRRVVGAGHARTVERGREARVRDTPARQRVMYVRFGLFSLVNKRVSGILRERSYCSYRYHTPLGNGGWHGTREAPALRE
ncbi:hypothetical protein MMON_05950 [Mycolicibacterium monacense]|uniref:Uncharacterized protein n=1 Tax=Mycolicibacterium monacense TaxID=85693 RepID=A0AAD1IRT3_MYCMB|nr:hypothetical protein MMON_05950 [Mycolicibacterium monacense]